MTATKFPPRGTVSPGDLISIPARRTPLRVARILTTEVAGIPERVACIMTQAAFRETQTARNPRPEVPRDIVAHVCTADLRTDGHRRWRLALVQVELEL